MKKNWILYILIMLFVAGLSSFGWLLYDNFKKSTASPPPLVVLAWDEWPGMLPYWVAYDLGYFKDAGVDVSMKKMESDNQMIDDLISGKIDFAPDIDLVYVMSEYSRGNQLQIVGVTDISSGGDGIAVKKGINSIGDLKNRKVATKRTSLGEKLLYYALIKSNLKLSDIKQIDLNATEAAKALSEGTVDAAVTYEPSLTKLKNEGFDVIFDSSLTPGILIDTLIAKKSFIDSNALATAALLNAYFRAVEFIKADPNEAYGIGAKYLNISESEFIKSYAGILQSDLRQNINSFSFSAGYESLYGNSALTNLYLIDINEIPEAVDIENILRPQFIRKIN